MSDFSSLRIGLSALNAQRRAIEVTGHNISNANTEGYSRQNVEQTAAPVIPDGRLAFGSGVMSKKVTRVSDEYLEKRIQNEHKNFANAEERSADNRKVESPNLSRPIFWILLTGYSRDGQANVTIAGNMTLSDLSEGPRSIIVYANDTAGNMGGF